MKIWEIKSQALSLMFTDTDMRFTKDDFENEIVYQNPNTNEKLTGMDGSIRRAIEIYYSYVGVSRRKTTIGLKKENDEYHNLIDITNIDNFQEPTRVDVLFFNSEDELLREDREVDFVFHKWDNAIVFDSNRYDHLGDQVKFRLYYKLQRLNVPYNAHPHDYDLDDIEIPAEVQLYIPYYIKAEQYEEDEPQVANMARQLYTQFLLTVPRPTIPTSGKVKKSKVFTNRGV